MTTTNEGFALTITKPVLMLKVGTKEKEVAIETALCIGGTIVGNLMKELGFASAFTKAQNGNYRAAVEVMSLAAHPSQVKTCTPPVKEDGGAPVWTKARVLMLAELTLERPAGKNGYSKKQITGRAMARALLDQFADKPADKTTPPADEVTEGDPLNSVVA